MKLMVTGIAPLGSSAYFQSIFQAQNSGIASLTDSVGRLTSGNRVLRIADDVGSFTLSSRLQAQVAGLKQASRNISQGIGLLQVATGGLREIDSTLQSLKSVATKASSASLTNNERAFLQQEFNTLLSSIDSVVDVTTFNSLRLLDGSLAGGVTLQQFTGGGAKATGTITFNDATTDGDIVSINNVLFEFGQSYEGVTLTSGTAAQSAANLAAVLNASNNAAVSQASYSADDEVLTITARAGGSLGNRFIIDDGQSTADITASGQAGFVDGGELPTTLSGGVDVGAVIGDVKAVGSVGNTLITTQNQAPASRLLTINGAVTDSDSITISGANSETVFTFSQNAVSQFEIQLGLSTEETLQNIISTLTNFAKGSSDDNADANDTRYELAQLSFEANNVSVIISNKLPGNPEALEINGGGNTVSIAATGNISVSGASLNNGARTGVDVSNVSNAAFVGAISGFEATYNSADNITASITVGDETYSATIRDTTPGADVNVTFKSAEGGSFDVLLRGGAGLAAGNQPQADAYAAALDEAFSGLTFYQERDISNFAGTGTLAGAKLRLQVNSNSAQRAETVSVTPPGNTPSALIEVRINGATFRSSFEAGKTIGANETITLRNVADSNQFLKLTTGGFGQDLSTVSAAAAFEQTLKDSLGLGKPGNGTDFIVGVSGSDVINVNIPNSNSNTLFGGISYNVLTQNAAQTALEAVETAQNTVQSLISYANAKQQAFQSAGVAVQAAISGVQAANSALADTDIIEESTQFAQKQLQVNASIAVVAQVLSLPSGLLSSLVKVGKN